MNLIRLALFSVLALAACASIKPLPYSASPGRISDPHAEVKSIILANTTSGCLAEPSFDKSMLVVKFVCSGGVGNSTARLDQVKKIVLEQYEEWYRVRVVHSKGAEDFSWTSKSLEDMQRLADALTALSQGETPGYAADKDATKI
jgi:hypothetical protein